MAESESNEAYGGIGEEERDKLNPLLDEIWENWLTNLDDFTKKTGIDVYPQGNTIDDLMLNCVKRAHYALQDFVNLCMLKGQLKQAEQSKPQTTEFTQGGLPPS